MVPQVRLVIAVAALVAAAFCGTCREAKLCCPGRDSSCVVQKAPPNAVAEDPADKPCYCDHACLKLGDCCDDFKIACGDVYNELLAKLRLSGRNLFGMLGPFPVLFTCDPKVFSLILGSPKHTNKPSLYSIVLENAVRNSLLVVNGNEWRQQRKMLNPALDYTNIMHNIHIFNSQSDNLIRALVEEVDKESTEVDAFIETWSLLQAYDTLIGGVGDSNTKFEFLEAIKCVMKIAVERCVRINEIFSLTYVFSKNFWLERRMLKIVFSHLSGVVKMKKCEMKTGNTKRERPILIDILLKQTETDENVTDSFIANQLNLMVAAGFDTTASAISFILYNLSIFTEVQQKAYEEVHSVLGDDINQIITHQHVTAMSYLDLVIKESMRLKSPVPFYLRKVEEDVDFEGTTLPKGLTVMLLAYAMHLDPELYPEPEKFIPERFLKENLNPNRYSYAPFCGGVRNCIGQKYAMLAMKVVLAKILLNYELLDAKHKLCLAAEITLRSKTGVRVVFRRRRRIIE